MDKLTFPENFMWGAAASSYQTEGHNTNCDWYVEEINDKKLLLENRRLTDICGQACDHWNRYKEDYDIAEKIGINIYRTSAEWSRVFPDENQEDPAAIAHYRQMFTDLKKRGIKLMLCLHHFTLPLWISRKGGFENKSYIIENFRVYAKRVVEALGDLVDYWLPVNEPNIVAMMCYLVGKFPPYKIDKQKFRKVLQTVLEIQLIAYDIIKNSFPNAPVGAALAFQHYQPYRPGSRKDIYYANLEFNKMNRWFLEGLESGRLQTRKRRNKNKIHKGIDFIGVNYYTSSYLKSGKPAPFKDGEVFTDMGWLVYPQGLYDVLEYAHNNFNVPVIITENGAATIDEDFRIWFISEHLKAVHKAVEKGFDIQGFMYWSLTDNYEWERGYTKKFGLAKVDFDTQERILKRGGEWYAGVIKQNGFIPKS
ncbi:MAG: glycoside hydrolase family 1 protein [Christensenellales bacterium]